jgi:hypothetical protein
MHCAVCRLVHARSCMRAFVRPVGANCQVVTSKAAGQPAAANPRFRNDFLSTGLVAVFFPHTEVPVPEKYLLSVLLPVSVLVPVPVFLLIFVFR